MRNVTLLFTLLLASLAFGQGRPANPKGGGGGITISGSPSAAQVTLFASGTAVEGDSNLTWDAADKRLYTGQLYPSTGDFTGAIGDSSHRWNNAFIGAIYTQGIGVLPGWNTYIPFGAKYSLPYADSSGTPGSATNNNPTGRAAVASGHSSCTISNSVVASTSIVRVQLETSGAGVAGVTVSVSSNSFTVTTVNGTGVATNATSNATFAWEVVN